VRAKAVLTNDFQHVLFRLNRNGLVVWRSGYDTARYESPLKNLARRLDQLGAIALALLYVTQDCRLAQIWNSTLEIYRTFAAPILFLLPAEAAHRLSIWALKLGLVPGARQKQVGILATEFCGLPLPNPIGLAAGYDKDCEIPGALLGLGFGFVEAGTVTPRPQPGNPKPRLFRLVEDGAVINRFGFNSRGHDEFSNNLDDWRASNGTGLVGVNVGKNKDSEDAAADYVAGVRRFAGVADYLVVNISSPNTPGLRDLQSKARLEKLTVAVIKARDDAAAKSDDGRRCPLLIKIAPDLDESALEDIAEIALQNSIDGIIATNTTVARPPGLRDAAASETGGLSGRPLFEPSTRLLGDLYRLTGGNVPLIGVGGVFTGRQAYEKILAGASLVQIYTSLIYRGPGAAPRICAELAECLIADGYAAVSDAVGASHR
jgi:dihydroorotate dehydrogenase